MSRIRKFEDIEAWQRARKLVFEIYSITNNNLFMKDFSLKDQIRRAAISVMLNIAEGFARKTKRVHSIFVHLTRFNCRGSIMFIHRPGFRLYQS